MATITTEITNEYFSQMNLRKPVCAYLDEIVMPWMDERTAKKFLAMIDDCGNTIVPVGTNAFEIIPQDYYKISVKNFLEQHYKRDWKEFHKATLEMNGVKVDD